MEIIENSEIYLKDFIRLNEEWIQKFFELEESDKALARNPKKIIDDGGYIFSLIHKGELVAVCALFNNNNGEYELARMATSPNHQGKGYSKKLMEHVFHTLILTSVLNSLHMVY